VEVEVFWRMTRWPSSSRSPGSGGPSLRWSWLRLVHHTPGR